MINDIERINMTPREVFSNNLRTLRIRSQMPQEELARLLGISVETVAAWEEFRSEPTLNMIGRIVKLFNTTFFYLLDSPRYYP